MSQQVDVSDERMNHMRAMEAASFDHEIKRISAQEGLYLGLTIETTEHPLLPFPTEEWFHPTDFGSLSPNASDKN